MLDVNDMALTWGWMVLASGYFVLRFLAEDAGKQLDHILDTILAALVHREKSRKR